MTKRRRSNVGLTRNRTLSLTQEATMTDADKKTPLEQKLDEVLSDTPTPTPAPENTPFDKGASRTPIKPVSTYTRPVADELIVFGEAVDITNALETFYALTAQTCPSGEETERFDQFFTGLGAEVDAYGNYYIRVGEQPTTLFTSHLDDVSTVRQNVTLRYNDKTRVLETDGRTILGADCKTGVAIMLYMISQQTPGLYAFFLEEEIGRKGSEYAARHEAQRFAGMERCVSFDRRAFGSVITAQSGKTCCSQDFAVALGTALREQLSYYQNVDKFFLPDAGGSYTDSYSFMYSIPECTNISIGCGNSHAKTEWQDPLFLTNLSEACAQLDWTALPTVRSPKFVLTDGAKPDGYAAIMQRWGKHVMASDFVDMVRADPDLAAAVIAELASDNSWGAGKAAIRAEGKDPDYVAPVVSYPRSSYTGGTTSTSTSTSSYAGSGTAALPSSSGSTYDDYEYGYGYSGVHRSTRDDLDWEDDHYLGGDETARYDWYPDDEGVIITRTYQQTVITKVFRTTDPNHTLILDALEAAAMEGSEAENDLCLELYYIGSDALKQ